MCTYGHDQIVLSNFHFEFTFLTFFFYQHSVSRWACDDTVTHYIYQGRVGDNTREYRGVKERGLHVVSQYWLHAVCFSIANFKGLNDTLLVKMQSFFVFFVVVF